MQKNPKKKPSKNDELSYPVAERLKLSNFIDDFKAIENFYNYCKYRGYKIIK